MLSAPHAAVLRRGRGTKHAPDRPATVVGVLVALAAVVAVGQVRMFPGPPTDTNPRANTPNDPDFDRAEPDDEDGDFMPNAASVFDEDHRLFGFAPNDTKNTALYRDSQNPRLGQPQVSGVSADLAWKLSTGADQFRSTNVFRALGSRLHFQ